MTQRCTASDEILVESDSSDKAYKVSFAEGMPTCNCVSFAIGRNRQKAKLEHKKVKAGNDLAWCKHIDLVYNKACKWRGESLIPGVCPECGSPTTEVEVSAQV